MFRYLPEQASTFAEGVDWTNNLITDLSVFFTVAIVGTMLYWAIKYRRKNGVDHETPQVKGSHVLEVIWTVMPTIICIFVGYYGILYHIPMKNVPADAMTVNVTAQKWRWDFEYPNGKTTSRELVVPVNKPVRLVMKSRDVLHSFFLPAMRVKADVVPGQYTSLWFQPVKSGHFQGYCTEYCGREHSLMLANLTVLPQAEYDRWIVDRSEEEALKAMSPIDMGRTLFASKGCNTCHSLNGSPLVGPSLLKVFGREEVMTDGTKLVVDENYIHESIVNPTKKVVKGFAPVMPSFDGQLSEVQISALISYIKAQDGTNVEAAAPTAAPVDAASLAAMSPADRGKALFTSKMCNACHSLDGSRLVGPSFKGIYGRKGKLVDGTEYEANDAYLKHSIVEPASQIVEGYPNGMVLPSTPNEEEIKDLIEFMKTLK